MYQRDWLSHRFKKSNNNYHSTTYGVDLWKIFLEKSRSASSTLQIPRMQSRVATFCQGAFLRDMSTCRIFFIIFFFFYIMHHFYMLLHILYSQCLKKLVSRDRTRRAMVTRRGRFWGSGGRQNLENLLSKWPISSPGVADFQLASMQ